MLVCKEELRRITVLSKMREHTFEQLGMDVKDFEAEDLKQGLHPDHEDELSASEKVQNALQRAGRQSEAFEMLFEDIGMSLTSVRRTWASIRTEEKLTGNSSTLGL